MKIKWLTASILLGMISFSPSSFATTTSQGVSSSAQSIEQLSNQLQNQLTAQFAKEAYTFTFPLVMNYRTMYMQAIKTGGMGQWLHLGLATPEDKDIVTPNLDTPYSYAWVDLRTEPWVLTIPKIEKDRFFTSQWDDMWGFVLDNVGSVNDGNDGEVVMLAGPNWQGDTPPNIDRVIQGESEFLGTLTRVQLMGEDNDIDRVKEIKDKLKLQPLSQYLNKEAPQDAPKIEYPEWKEGIENTEQYWNYVAFILQYVKPNSLDKDIYAKLELLGIEPGKPWQKESLSNEQLNAMQKGLLLARLQMKEISNEPIEPSKLFQTRENLKDDYISRAMGVYVGIFGNTKDQAVYFTIAEDNKGNLLDATKNEYELTLPANNMPPVKYFWSFTMYKLPERLLVENPDNRYSFNNDTPDLIENDDGSITFHISSKKPENKKTNWLPAPEGPFWTVIRTYGPDEDILNGFWKAPSVNSLQ
ncbi:DUF1254 domain-containing protein [Aliivibrio sifiae]|uniref:DUF1254 domain-containing protein n=1 Tax=Aliivibrio sifiae TaxID=566293 RepID=A0A2S7XC95_9GAMM|nr:DUF1254 domain-containing protein [Aliivibrio sifiae]PQJ88979.1 hypothetical protein BTO22_05005 [Aliivibrio sifiae]